MKYRRKEVESLFLACCHLGRNKEFWNLCDSETEERLGSLLDVHHSWQILQIRITCDHLSEADLRGGAVPFVFSRTRFWVN